MCQRQKTTSTTSALPVPQTRQPMRLPKLPLKSGWMRLWRSGWASLEVCRALRLRHDASRVIRIADPSPRGAMCIAQCVRVHGLCGNALALLVFSVAVQAIFGISYIHTVHSSIYDSSCRII